MEVEIIEQVEIQTQIPELIPPEGSEDVGIAVISMLDEILQYREDLKLAEKFNRFYQLRRNKHWKNKNKNISLVSANLLGAHHSKTVNMLTDNNPTFNAVQAGEMDQDSAEKLSLLVKTTDSWWNETEQQHVFEESVSTGELYGMVGEFVSFNPDINFPEGDVETETLDPLYFSCYPPKCRKVEKAEAMLRWYPMSVREARRRWPEAAEYLQGDESLLSEIGDERHDENVIKGNGTKQTVLNSLVRWLSGSSQTSGDSETDELFVIEAWVKDFSGKYPGNIRRIQVANAGEVVLSDVPNPSINPELPEEISIKNYLFSRFPFSMTPSVTDPTSPFGFADFEQLEQLNIEMNKTMSQFTLFKNKAYRLKLLNPRDSGVTNQELDNTPGPVNPTNSLVSQAIRYIDPPKMSTDIPMALSLYKDMFHEIAGSFQDVMQGQKNGSEVVAAKAIAMLLEEASRMARGKIRNYSKMLRERGRMFLALAQNWYDTDRYITFQRQGKEVTQPVNRETLQIAGKINVVNGSTMPVSLIQKREESMALAKMGMIDQEEVLKAFDWDNYKDVIARMQQGPIGEFVQKMGAIGVPKEMLGFFQKLAGVGIEDIQKMVEAGEIPGFMQMVQMMAGQQQPPSPEMIQSQIEQQKLQIESAKAQADIRVKDAQARKTEAEIMLEQEKIATERIEQQIKAKGVQFDEEKLKMTRAEIVAKLKSMERADKRADAEFVSNLKDRQQGRKIDVAKTVIDAQSKTNTGNGDYRERGLTSNNKDIE